MCGRGGEEGGLGWGGGRGGGGGDQFDKATYSASVVADAAELSSPASDRAAKSPQGPEASLCPMTTSMLASSGSILLNASFQYQLRVRSSFRHTETAVGAALGANGFPRQERLEN